jgi:hypothetical protein
MLQSPVEKALVTGTTTKCFPHCVREWPAADDARGARWSPFVPAQMQKTPDAGTSGALGPATLEGGRWGWRRNRPASGGCSSARFAAECPNIPDLVSPGARRYVAAFTRIDNGVVRSSGGGERRGTRERRGQNPQGRMGRPMMGKSV